MPIVDGTLSVAIELGLSANKTAARSAAPSGLDEDFVYAATIFHSASYESLKICEYNYDSATNKATLKIPFALSEAARANHVLNICAFPAETDLDSFASVADAILNSVLHGTTTISTAANSISATLGDSVVKLFPKSGNGTVELEITLPSADYTLSCSDETNFTITGTSPNYVLKNAGSGIASGSYPVTLKVSKDSNVVYTRNETINVFPAMKSDVWFAGDGTSSSNATLSISVSEIDSTLYVCGSGSTWFLDFGSSIAGDDTTGNGSIGRPYATIQKAIERIKATTTSDTDSFTIYVDGTVTASGSTPVADFSEIQSGCSIAIKGLDATNKATLDGNNKTAQGIKAGTYDGLNETRANLNLTLENLIVKKGNGTRGGGILLVTETANTHTISNCEISSNTATSNGGGVYKRNGNLTLESGTISGNSANYGGGVYNYSGTFTMSGGTIGNASATAVASELSYSNKARSHGGGIYNYGGTVTLSGGNIFYNYAGYGGGIFNSNSVNSELVMGSDSTTTIKYNCCGTNGGGIYSEKTFTMQAGTITNNYAKYGGGICNAGGSGTFTLSGGEISGNSANYGGGVYNISGTVTMSGGTIKDNTATGNGGGIYNNAGTFTMSGGKISDNSATTNGSGIYNNGTLNFSGAAVVDSGNDVYLYADKFITVTGDLTATGAVATITPNSYDAGTVVLKATTAALLSANIGKFSLPSTVTNYAIAQDDTDDTTKKTAVIVDNTPRTPVYLDATGGSDLNDGSTKANAVKTLKRATSILKDAAGAKIIIVSAYTLASTETGLLDFSTKVASPKVVTLERYYASSSDYFNGTLLMISSGTVVIKNVTFDGNWKANGGTGDEQITTAGGVLLYVDSGATVTLGAGCTIKNNLKSGNGGGIYNKGTLNLSGGTISGNTAASGGGGGIYNTSGGTITMSGGTIGENKASTNGGGIYNYGGTITMNSGTISTNSAKHGSGISNNSGTFTMSGGTISGNKATGYGGGIYNNGTVTLSGGTISGNTVTTGNGGGIYHYDGTLNFSGAAAVNANNDVFLKSEKFITVTGNLTGTNVATIKPASYAANTVVLKAANAELITNNYSKFALSDASTYAICPDSATPTQAVLAKPSAGLDIGLLGSDFVFTPKINNADIPADKKLAAGNVYVLTFTLTPTSVTGTTFTDYKIAVRQHNTTDDLSTLTAHGSTLSAATTTITAALSNAFKQVEAIDIYMEVTVRIDENGLVYRFDRTVEGFTFQ